MPPENATNRTGAGIIGGNDTIYEAGGVDLVLRCGKSSVMNAPTPFPNSAPTQIAFHRTELNAILSLYGRFVAAGEWRDYGISHLKEVAVFSVFRRTAEHPMYRIEKRPNLRMKQGQYTVIGMEGRILKRGNDLRQVLRVLERKLIRAID
jgi:hypothetical protein